MCGLAGFVCFFVSESHAGELSSNHPFCINRQETPGSEGRRERERRKEVGEEREGRTGVLLKLLPGLGVMATGNTASVSHPELVDRNLMSALKSELAQRGWGVATVGGNTFPPCQSPACLRLLSPRHLRDILTSSVQLQSSTIPHTLSPPLLSSHPVCLLSSLCLFVV